MKFAKVFAALVVVALLALWASPASAQDATITVDPASVEAAGPADFTVVGAGFPAGAGVFVLACPGAEGDPDAITEDNAPTLCDIANMANVTAGDDGSFEAMLSAEVPEEGLVILGAVQDPVTQASVVITVGGGEEPTEEPTAEATETPTEEATATETATTTEEMPTTGGESGMLAIIGASIVIAGFLFVGMGRRLGKI